MHRKRQQSPFQMLQHSRKTPAPSLPMRPHSFKSSKLKIPKAENTLGMLTHLPSSPSPPHAIEGLWLPLVMAGRPGAAPARHHKRTLCLPPAQEEGKSQCKVWLLWNVGCFCTVVKLEDPTLSHPKSGVECNSPNSNTGGSLFEPAPGQGGGSANPTFCVSILLMTFLFTEKELQKCSFYILLC